jgi:hypothetical protein
VLAVSPANAISVTINPKNTVTSSVPGAVLFDDFDSVQNTAIGTITGGRPQDPTHGSPPATGNFIIADGLLGASTNVTVMLTDPVSYVGFAWGTPDPMNKVDVYNGSTLLGSIFGDFAIGASAFTYYFDIHAGSGEAITKLVLSSTVVGDAGCCFETDNYSASSVPAPIAGAGLPGLLGLGLIGLARLRRKRNAWREMFAPAAH